MKRTELFDLSVGEFDLRFSPQSFIGSLSGQSATKSALNFETICIIGCIWTVERVKADKNREMNLKKLEIFQLLGMTIFAASHSLIMGYGITETPFPCLFDHYWSCSFFCKKRRLRFVRNKRKLKRGRRQLQPQRRGKKITIWLVKRGKIFVLRVRHAL